MRREKLALKLCIGQNRQKLMGKGKLADVLTQESLFSMIMPSHELGY